MSVSLPPYRLSILSILAITIAINAVIVRSASQAALSSPVPSSSYSAAWHRRARLDQTPKSFQPPSQQNSRVWSPA
ncbi:hypothetical protein ACQKWADRAFT_281513 [Trichoderma austrokoningii]